MGALIGIDQSSDFRPLERERCCALLPPPLPPPSLPFPSLPFARQFRRGKYLIDSSVCNPVSQLSLQSITLVRHPVFRWYALLCNDFPPLDTALWFWSHRMHLYTGALSLIRSSLFSSRPATLISRAPVNIRYETTFVPPVHPSTLSQGCFQFFRNFFFLCEFFFFFLLLRIYIYTRNASPFHNRAAPNRFGLRDHKFGKRRYESVRAYLFVDIIRFARNFVFCIFFL